jgi:predicted house-cleaning noncanonical NTP pyrophosphatase (MazG superfamily)
MNNDIDSLSDNETKLLEEIHDFFNSEYVELSSDIFKDILNKYMLNPNKYISINKKRNKPNMNKVNKKKKKRYH